MDLLIAGLAGVALGAAVATAIFLLALQRRGDRDLVERRVRACAEYRDLLGDLRAGFEEATGGDPGALAQGWHDVASFRREFRLSGWVLAPPAREGLERIVAELEAAERAWRANGTGSGERAAQLLCEKYHQVDAILRREIEAGARRFTKFRFLPEGPGRS